jgi:hypothetical protein
MSMRSSLWWSRTVFVAAPAVGLWLCLAPRLGADEQGPQNTSKTEEWDLGQRFRGQDTPIELMVNNGCKVGQSVTAEVKTFPLKAPASLDLGPYRNDPLKMTLELSQPPVRFPPYPPGTVFNCHTVKGTLTLTHQEAKLVRKVDGGTETYTCFGTTHTYNISMFLHDHPAPDAQESGGGRGGKKKPNRMTTCDVYWSVREFFPNPTQTQPEQCQSEIQPLAQDFFGPALDPIRKVRPQDFEFVPKPEVIERMPVRDLMELKSKVDIVVRAMK